MTPASERPALRLIVPDQAEVSGGGVVNARLAEALTARGWTVDVHPIAGSWPKPRAAHRAAVATALSAGSDPVLIDGLVGSACPEQIEAAVAAGVRVVVFVHLPLPAERGRGRAEEFRLAQLERRALHAATAIVVPSYWARADLHQRYGLTAHVLTPGADPAPVAVGSDPPQLLMLAALTPTKNHLTAMVALKALGDLSWRATFVGAHRDTKTLSDIHLRRTPPISDRLTLPGELTGAALEQVWRATDLLLVPSWTETYGLVVAEALAHGIPAIVSRGTGAAEALAGVTNLEDRDLPGALADPGNPGEWADVIRGWLESRVRRDGWRQAALARRDSLRTWADTAADLERLLEELR